MSATLPEITQAIVLRPGDKLLLRLADDVDEELARHLLEVLKERWPEVPALVMTGDVEVTVVRTVAQVSVYVGMIHDLEKEAEIE